MKAKEINWRKHMVELIKKQLGVACPVEILDGYPEIVNAIADGQPAPMVAEVLTAKIIRLAIAADKPNQWAIDLIYDRVVGRPQQSPTEQDGGRRYDEKLEDVTTDHLNQLAKQFAASGGGIPGARQAQDTPDRQLARAVVDLPADGIGGAQGSGGEPEMA